MRALAFILLFMLPACESRPRATHHSQSQFKGNKQLLAEYRRSYRQGYDEARRGWAYDLFPKANPNPMELAGMSGFMDGLSDGERVHPFPVRAGKHPKP